jgi:hypothetical protein
MMQTKRNTYCADVLAPLELQEIADETIMQGAPIKTKL